MTSTFHRQAALVSWVAPLLALFVGLFVKAVPWDNPSGGTLILVAMTLTALIALGLLAGIVALIGTWRTRRPGAIAPAIVGLVLGLFILSLMSTAVLRKLQMRQPAISAPVGMTPPPMSRAEIEDSILEAEGWAGEVHYGGATLTLSTIDPMTPFGARLDSSFSRPYQMVLLVIDAEGAKTQLVVVLEESVVHLTDGTTIAQAATDEVWVLIKPSVGINLAGLQLFKFALTPGRDADGKGLLFLPPGLDPARIDHIDLRVNGGFVTVPGSHLSPEQKAANLARVLATRPTN